MQHHPMIAMLGAPCDSAQMADGPVDAFEQCFNTFDGGEGVRAGSCQVVKAVTNGGKRLIDLMADGSGHLSERRHLARLHQVALRAFQPLDGPLALTDGAAEYIHGMRHVGDFIALLRATERRW